ncbi:hypothetical protein ACFL38_02455 [Candidatus Omnitrophota bacterium]
MAEGTLLEQEQNKRKQRTQQRLSNIFLLSLAIAGVVFILFFLMRNAILAPQAARLAVTLRAEEGIDMPSTASIISATVLVGVGIGLLIGIPVGFLSVSAAVKSAIRKRLASKKYDENPIDFLSDTRRESRIDIKDLLKEMVEQGEGMNRIIIDIRAPMFDAAGFPLENEELKFNAELVTISRHGAAVIAFSFLPVGVNVKITCKTKKIDFEERDAQVRYVVLGEKGLRVGFEFFKPLECL